MFKNHSHAPLPRPARQSFQSVAEDAGLECRTHIDAHNTKFVGPVSKLSHKCCSRAESGSKLAHVGNAWRKLRDALCVDATLNDDDVSCCAEGANSRHVKGALTEEQIKAMTLKQTSNFFVNVRGLSILARAGYLPWPSLDSDLRDFFASRAALPPLEIGAETLSPLADPRNRSDPEPCYCVVDFVSACTDGRSNRDILAKSSEHRRDLDVETGREARRATG